MKKSEIEYGSFVSVESSKTDAEKSKQRKGKKSKKKYSTLSEKEQKVFLENSHPETVSSIRARLFFLVLFAIVFSLAAVILFSNYFIAKDSVKKSEENNYSDCQRLAMDFENRLDGAISSALLFKKAASNSGNPKTLNVDSTLFSLNENLAYLYFSDTGESFSNVQYSSLLKLDEDNFDAYLDSEKDSMKKCREGNFLLKNASEYFGANLMSVFYPFGKGKKGRKDVMVLLYYTEGILDSIKNDKANFSFLVNQDDEFLIFPKVSEKKERLNSFADEVIKEMLEESSTSNQKHFFKGTENEFIGSYYFIQDSECAVISVAPLALLLESQIKIFKWTLYLSALVLFIVMMLVLIFSRKIKASAGTRVMSLQERKKKELPAAYQADISIMYADIRDFSGIKQNLVMHYGQKAGIKTINLLNDYFSRISECIVLTGGKIVKIEGDGVLCLWGADRTSLADIEKTKDAAEKKKLQDEYEDAIVQDAINSIISAIAMRYAIGKYNQEVKNYPFYKEENENLVSKSFLKIGSSINSGSASIGYVGSFMEGAKIEQTAIGDALTFAKKSEKINKLCGTDIILSQETMDLLKLDYVKCKENNFSIPKKNEKYEIVVERIPVAIGVKNAKKYFYGVVNMPAFNIEEFFSQNKLLFTVDSECARLVGPSGPKTLKELRNLLGIPESDTVSVNLDTLRKKNWK